MKRLLALVFLAILAASPALANAPLTISYQGVLTDNAGNLVADGNYNLTFNLYTVPVAGASIWTETQNNVPVAKGGFNVLLGSVASLSALTFDAPYYLGVAVNGGAELSPRIALASSPYSLGLKLPFTISQTPGQPLIQGDNLAGFGGSLQGLDSSGNTTWFLEPDFNGSGAFMFLTRNGTNGGFTVDGNFAGTGNTSVSINGTSSMTFNTNSVGDASVVLPADAISAGEILDEPGIAQGKVNGSVSLSTVATMADIVTVTITTPAPGYIVVQASGQHRFDGDGVNSNVGYFQIDETAGGAIDGNHYNVSGWFGGSVNVQSYHPMYITRTYFKSAGTYTFRLEAYASNPGALTNYIYNPVITAIYTPTGYGAVTTAPTLTEEPQFSQVQRTWVPSNGVQVGGNGSLVDLRELELRATKAKEAAERAQKELLQAEFQNQVRARVTGAAVKKN
jgi:hypothetical protein